MRVVLDANVLFPLHVRDLLLFANLMGQALFLPTWSDEILDEMGRNLVARGLLRAEQLGRLVGGMNGAFPDALRNPPRGLVAAMTNDPGDRHVLATAVHARAGLIVTQNLRHFPTEALAPHGVEVQGLDDFLLGLWRKNPETILLAVQHLLGRYTRPPLTSLDLVAVYAAQAPCFAERLRVSL